MTALAGTIIAAAMDLETARLHVVRIKDHIDRADYHIDQARKLIWELKEQCGWKVLGYSSWHKCVTAEFSKSSSTVYRQLSAALVELELSPSGTIGEINERVLRPLTQRNFDAEARQAIWSCAQEIVGEGGKVTSGIVEAVVEGFKDMLQSGAVQDADGNQHAITEMMQADLVARVRQVKLAHRDHIKRMGAEREYLSGGNRASIARINFHMGAVQINVTDIDSLNLEKITEAMRLDKPIYCSLWTE